MPTTIERMDVFSLPTIALRGLTVFPNIATSFDVTRKISIDAIESALAGDSSVFIVTQRDVSVENPQRSDLFDVGIIAKIKQSLKLPDNQYRVIVEGVGRAELIDIKEGSPIVANVVRKEIELADETGGLRAEALIRSANDALREYLK